MESYIYIIPSNWIAGEKDTPIIICRLVLIGSICAKGIPAGTSACIKRCAECSGCRLTCRKCGGCRCACRKRSGRRLSSIKGSRCVSRC